MPSGSDLTTADPLFFYSLSSIDAQSAELIELTREQRGARRVFPASL
jgi:hypothetical protein